MSWLSLLTEIPRAVLALRDILELANKWWKSLEEKEREKWRNDVRSAYDKLLKERDQRDLEKILGSDKAGQPSGLPDSVFIPDNQENPE